MDTFHAFGMMGQDELHYSNRTIRSNHGNITCHPTCKRGEKMGSKVSPSGNARYQILKKGAKNSKNPLKT